MRHDSELLNRGFRVVCPYFINTCSLSAKAFWEGQVLLITAFKIRALPILKLNERTSPYFEFRVRRICVQGGFASFIN